MILTGISDINKELRVGIPRNVYLILGSDIYLKGRYIDKIEKLVLGDNANGMNKYVFAGNPFDVEKFFDATDMIPFGGRVFVQVNDFKPSLLSDNDYNSFLEQVGALGDGTTVVIVAEEGFDEKKGKGQKLTQVVEKAGAVFKPSFAKKSELADFLRTRIEKNKSTIKMDVVYKLIDYCGEEPQILTMEADKLALYAGENEITEDMIYKVCSATIEGNIFNISTKMLKKDLKGALLEIDALVYNKVDPYRILSTLSYKFADFLAIKMGMEKGKIAFEIKKELKMKSSDRVIEFQMKDIRHISKHKLFRANEIIAEGDYKHKTIAVDSRLLIEGVVVDIMRCIAEN